MSLYSPNGVCWKVGDIVIHDVDRKEQKMLMEVVKIKTTKSGSLYYTKYLFPEKLVANCLYRKYGSYDRIPKLHRDMYEGLWENDKKYLHDPCKFDIEIPKNHKLEGDGK